MPTGREPVSSNEVTHSQAAIDTPPATRPRPYERTMRNPMTPQTAMSPTCTRAADEEDRRQVDVGGR